MLLPAASERGHAGGMSDFDPTQTDDSWKPEHDREREDVALPTRFGRETRRRRPRPEPATREDPAGAEPWPAADDEMPFVDHGGL
jgi:hypothetical protein